MRIGLTLLTPDELVNFPDALRWIMETDHSAPGPRRIPAMVTFQPGPMPNDVIVAAILRRKIAATMVPYAFVVLAFGNHQYQVGIPATRHDRHLHGTSLNQPALPMMAFVLDPGQYGQPRFEPLDLFDTTPIKGEPAHIDLHYDKIIPIRPSTAR